MGKSYEKPMKNPVKKMCNMHHIVQNKVMKNKRNI